MNTKLKDINDVIELQGEIYSRRQEAVENYASLASTLAGRTKEYKEKHKDIYRSVRAAKYPNTTTLMFPTDTAARQEVDGQLAGEKQIIDIISEHLNYLSDTIKTIDGIIYSIRDRIRLEELKLGK